MTTFLILDFSISQNRVCARAHFTSEC